MIKSAVLLRCSLVAVHPWCKPVIGNVLQVNIKLIVYDTLQPMGFFSLMVTVGVSCCYGYRVPEHQPVFSSCSRQ